MARVRDLRERMRRPELMDGPGLDEAEHRRALADLDRLNRMSRTLRQFAGPILDLARKRAPEPLRVLDLATGSGWLPLALWRRGRRAGLEVLADGCDRSAVAVACARERAAAAGAPCRYLELDALAGELPAGYDAICSCLFLHHLDEAPARELLARMARAAGGLVVVDDLSRSPLAWWFTRAGTQIFSRSPVVHADGPVSVEGAYTIDEARALAESAGLSGFELRPRWPFRWRLLWTRPRT